jgi:Fe-S cluster biogenesis protein NfuA
MFIQTEETPNPATLKFVPGREVMANGTLDVTDARTAVNSPLAEALFGIEGVRGVFLGGDFVTVTKAADKGWPALKPPILAAIMDHFANNRPIVLNVADASGAIAIDETEIEKQIREILDVKVRPAVAQDGGDITFQSFEDGVVYLNLKGSCAGCPSSTATLKAGIENMLKHYIPEVKEVRQVAVK